MLENKPNRSNSAESDAPLTKPMPRPTAVQPVPTVLREARTIAPEVAPPVMEPVAEKPAAEKPKPAGLKGFLKSVKGIIAVIAAIGVLTLIGHWVYGMITTEATDDAFVVGHVHTISARVQGSVVQVLVNDNEHVKKGDVLINLDPREYEASVKNAQAKYSKAHKDLGRMAHGRTPVAGDDADDDDDEGGSSAAFLPDERPILDQYQADALSSEAALRTAILHYQFTKIVAPEDGVIGKKSVETGQMIQPGQALMALVEPDPWVVANFKEGQVSRIRIGQKVDVGVDAIPEHEFEGKVESIAPGSGSTFSLLPPDNATGNFTKVVQRIPVKIVLTKESTKGFEDRLVPGMSTEVKIRVR